MMYKGFLRVLGWAMMALPILAVSAAGAADVPSIEVRGKAVISVPPDRAFITLAIEARHPQPEAAQVAVAKASQTVLGALEGAQLGSDALRTLSYSLQEEYDWEDRKRTLRGYVARNTIEVRVDEVTRVGEILGLAVGTGATSVSGLRFDTSDREALERQALQQAVAQARAFAMAAAAGADVTLGAILEIQQEGGTTPAPRVAYARSMAADAKGAAPPIESGDIEIRASARIRVAIGGN
jgi:uncharacterized protein YggE